jgi:hypothetical protein
VGCEVTTDLSQHIQRIDHAHMRLDKHEGRIVSLETHTAVAAERAENIKKSLDKLESGQSWLIRLVLGAIVAAGLAILMKGGVNVP